MKKKQKVIIVSNNLAIGGIQKALVNLLNEIKDQFEMTLFIFSDHGHYASEIPREVKVIKAGPYLKLLGISQYEAKREGLIYYFLRALAVLWTRLFGNEIPIRILLANEAELDSYDIAISFVQSPHEKFFYGGCDEFVLKKIDATKKIAYVHCDYLCYGGNTENNRRRYREFNRIITVSKGCRRNFLKAIPELSYKTYSVQNCHPYVDIRRKADESPIQYNKGIFNIVTVARLSEEKGIVRTVSVIENLLKKGYKICWHIIGDGNHRRVIEGLISSGALQKWILLYGDQENPYKYMKNADLFLLPSYHEAAPMVIEEAKCIGLPILTTETTSADEMIEQCGAGWVCENSIEGLAEKLEYILKNKKERLAIRKNLISQDFDNKLGLKQLNDVLNGEDANG